MTLATTNRAQLRYIAESAFGTIPGVGNPNDLRFTGESLAFSIKTDTSKEIRSDRQTTDLVQVGASAQGGINFELSYKEFDTFLQAALMGTWSPYGTAGVSAAMSLDINSTAGTIDATGITGNDDFANLAVGQWFKLNAPGDAADGAFLQVATRDGTTDTITVSAATPIPGSGTRTAVAGCTIASSRLVNGTTMRSFTLERGLTDVNQFFAYRGMNLGKMSMSFASGSIVTGSFDFTGKDADLAGATQLPGTPVASQTYDVMNAVNGVGNILENGTALAGTFIKSLKIDIDNKLRSQDGIGSLGAVGIGAGTLAVTGEIELYLANGTMYQKFIDNTASSIMWSVKDGAGNGYVFQLPKLRYSDAKVVAGNSDADVMLSMPFTALMDPTTGKTLLIDRLGA